MVASTNWKKLLAAGCVVGLLSGVSVQVEADGMEEYDDPNAGDGGDTDAYGQDAFDLGDEDNVDEDPYAEPTDEDPYAEEYPYAEEDPYAEEEDPYAEEPDDPYAEEPEEEPEEPMAMAPETMAPATAPEADGETAPVPDPDSLKALGFDVEEGVDYIPGPGKTAMVGDVDNVVVESAEECAAECEANLDCNIAAYFTADFPNGFNCWLKGLNPGCMLPPDTDPVENGWLLLSDNRCEVEVAATAPAATAPAAAVSGTYTRHPGQDYIPAAARPDITSTLVTVTDIDTGGDDAGLLVDTVADCEAACDLEAPCNAASFYTNVIAETGTNCFLKVIGEACELPTDALDDSNATLSLKCDVAGAPGLAAAPPASALTPALAPAAGPSATPPASDTTTRDAGDLSTTPEDGETVAEETPNGVAGVCTSMAAVAVAGAVALL